MPQTSFLPPSAVLLLLKLTRICYPSINTRNKHEALIPVEGPGSHLEISQKHPVPQAATSDAKKLQLINQICVIKPLFFYLITHLELIMTNYRQCVLVDQEMVTKITQHRKNSKASYVSHYHPSVSLWWLLLVLIHRWKNVILKMYANSNKKK